MIVTFKIDHVIHPSARGRKGKYGNFYSPTGKEINSLGWEFKAQCGHTINWEYPVTIKIIMSRNLMKTNHDLDNVIKTIIDALVQSTVIKDDKIIYIHEIQATISENLHTMIGISDEHV